MQQQKALIEGENIGTAIFRGGEPLSQLPRHPKTSEMFFLHRQSFHGRTDVQVFERGERQQAIKYENRHSGSFWYLRNSHQDLLISITNQLRLRIQPLIPRLLDNRHPRPRLAFIQCDDLIEVDLGVEIGLQGRREVVGVVMPAMGVVVVVVVV
jgi:hypothetical protein